MVFIYVYSSKMAGAAFRLCEAELKGSNRFFPGGGRQKLLNVQFVCLKSSM